jgi:hypothetical protein
MVEKSNSEPVLINAETLESMRKILMKKFAEEILGVQPMPNNLFSDLYNAAKSEKELIDEGYEPICSHIRFMWRKKGQQK